MGYRKILVVLDDSQLSELVLQHAVKVAKEGAHIYLKSVVGGDVTPELIGSPSEASSDSYANNAREKHLAGIQDWLEQDGYQVTLIPHNSDIIQTAQQDFEIIVMAKHSRMKGDTGSLADTVLSESPCPVLAVLPRIIS